MANANPAHIVLRNVRLSYVHLNTPQTQDDGSQSYNCTLLIPKSDPRNKQMMDAAVAAATQSALQRIPGFPANPKNTIKDGDGVRPSDGQPYGAECHGHWVLVAKSSQRPNVVDMNIQPILDQTKIYSGVYANVGVTFFAFNQPTNKGITAALDNVQIIADGEPLGGERASAEDDFGSPAAQQPIGGEQLNATLFGTPQQASAVQYPAYGADLTALL